MDKKLEKAMHTMDVILASIAVFLLLFTVTMIVIFCVKDNVPDTLITAVFTACTGECGAMAVIQGIKTMVRYKYGRVNNGCSESSSNDSNDYSGQVFSALSEEDDLR